MYRSKLPNLVLHLRVILNQDSFVASSIVEATVGKSVPLSASLAGQTVQAAPTCRHNQNIINHTKNLIEQFGISINASAVSY